MLCFQLFLMTRLNQTDFVGTLYFQRISVIQLYNGTGKRQSRLSVKRGVWRVGRKQIGVLHKLSVRLFDCIYQLLCLQV